MKSPFPGMDPYLEGSGRWRSFHVRLISRIIDMLEEKLPAKYRVLPEVREVVELVEEEGKSQKSMYPDAGVIGPSARSTPATEVAVAEPQTSAEPFVLRPLIGEEFREQFIEIFADEPDRRLVTCIEVLSPSNKRRESAGRAIYLRKRQALFLSETNLVEIDLLRGGERMPMRDPWPDTPYRLLVSRGWKAPACHVWTAHFRTPLPEIPVPLDAADTDLPLLLQPMIESVYLRSRFGENIDYSKPLVPPLSEADQNWLREQLKERGGNPSPEGEREK
jgi:hypothetical protein